jgi:hypothetical protein
VTLTNNDRFFTTAADQLQRAYLELNFHEQLDTKDVQPLPTSFFDSMKAQVENLSEQEKEHILDLTAKVWNDITEKLPNIIDSENSETQGQ